MSWHRVDDKFAAHPKVEHLERLGPERHAFAIAAWTLLGSDCALLDLGGVVTESRVSKVLSAWPAKVRGRAISDLVEVGLFDRVESELVFHDWEEYRPKHRTEDDFREYEAKRKSAWRARTKASGTPPEDPKPPSPGQPQRTSVRDMSGTSAGHVPPLPTRPDPSRPVPTKSALALSERAPAPALVEHVLLEAKRVIGRAWGNFEQIREAWDGGGLRTLHSDVDRFKAVLVWASDEPDPKAALTRSIEGYGATSDDLVVKSNRSFAVFAKDPGRWMKHASAISSAPSDFSNVDTNNPNLPAWLREETQNAG